MFDGSTFRLFLATAVVLVLSPGPDTLLILSRTLASGSPAGLWTLLGTQAGNVIHAVLAGIGVSTLVLHFPIAFEALKFAGVAYLLYLAIQAWRAPAEFEVALGRLARASGARRYFAQGLLNNLANPKMIAFFLALFPQFVNAENGSVALQSFVLGSTLAAIAILWIGALVLLAGRARRAVSANPIFLTIVNRLASVTFAGLAVRLALQDRS